MPFLSTIFCFRFTISYVIWKNKSAFFRKGNVTSDQKIQFYVYNKCSYKIAPARNFRPMGTNIIEAGPY